jgi:MFS transporter, DHA1 family, inner membrane transport protein
MVAAGIRGLAMTAETASGNWVVPIAALLVATFAIVTAEMVVAGLLPALAADLDVTIPVAGQLITGYAIGVGIAGPILALLTSRMPRRMLLLAIMAVYIAGNVLCALATSYWTLMGARIVLSACHGIHFGVAMVVATRVAPEGRKATAVSLVVAGVSAATILGVPLGTAIGNAYGWRTTFWVGAALGVVALIVLALFIPNRSGESSQQSDMKMELAAAVRPIALLCYAIFGALLVSYFMMLAYIVPFLTDAAGIALDMVPWVLLAMGIASFLGTLAGGQLGDRNPAATLIGAFALMALFLAALGQFAPTAWTAVGLLLLAWLSAFSIPAVLQSRLLREASDAPNFAATLMNTSGQVGIAAGAALGGVVIATGWSYGQLPLLAASFSTLALLGAFILVSNDRRRGLQPA